MICCAKRARQFQMVPPFMLLVQSFEEKLNQDLLSDFQAKLMLSLASAKYCAAFVHQMPESLELVFGKNSEF